MLSGMAKVRCPRCKEIVVAPDDDAVGTCPHCGQRMSMPSTHVKSAPPPPATGAIQKEAPAPEHLAPVGSTETYSTWDDFRFTSPAIQNEMLALATRRLPDLRDVPVYAVPESAPKMIDDWSEPLGTLRIPGESWVSRWIGIAALATVGLGLSGGPMSCMIMAAIDANRRADALFSPVLLIYLGLGCACLYFAWRLTFRRPILALDLWIFEEGLLLRRGGELIVARYQDIQDYEVSRETGRPLFWLTLRDEDPIILSVGHTRQVLPLMEYMEIRIAGAQLLPRLKSIWEGEREKFGIVTLDRDGYHSPKFVVPWSDLVRIDCDDCSMYVRFDKRRDKHVIRYRDVSFPQLVLALAKILKKEHSRLGPIDS